MASIVPGYEYDTYLSAVQVFISYRQKDDKGDRWVIELTDLLNSNLPYSNLHFGKL
jgi:hypothetical protein